MQHQKTTRRAKRLRMDAEWSRNETWHFVTFVDGRYWHWFAKKSLTLSTHTCTHFNWKLLNGEPNNISNMNGDTWWRKEFKPLDMFCNVTHQVYQWWTINFGDSLCTRAYLMAHNLSQQDFYYLSLGHCNIHTQQHVTHIDTYVDVNTNTTQNECTTTHIHATTNMHTTNTHKQACKSTRSHICFNKCTKEHTNKQTNKPHQKRSKQTDKQTNKQTNDENKRNQWPDDVTNGHTNKQTKFLTNTQTNQQTNKHNT